MELGAVVSAIYRLFSDPPGVIFPCPRSETTSLVLEHRCMAPPITSWSRSLQFGMSFLTLSTLLLPDNETTLGLAHLQFLLLSLSLLFTSVSSRLVNITVDDTFGDRTTGSLPQYSPKNDKIWHVGSSTEDCGCNIGPSIIDVTQPQDGTWHDATPLPSDPTPATITIHFTGSAVYVFNILPNTLPVTVTFANISFSIDGEDAGVFTRSPLPGTTILYNQLVYHNTGLNYGPHTLIITPSNYSLLLFDYLLYTTQDNDTVPDSSSINTSQSSSSSTFITPQSLTSRTPMSASTSKGSSQPSSSRTPTPIGSIVGAVLGGTALLGAVVGTFFLYRRHTRSRATEPNVHGSKHGNNGSGSEHGHRVGGDHRWHVSQSFSPPPSSGAHTSLPEPIPLDGAMARNLSDPASEVPGRDTRLWLGSADAIPRSPSAPVEWTSERHAELTQRLKTLQHTRSILSSQTPSRRTFSEAGSNETTTEAAIRELEAEMYQLRGVLTALNARLADGHSGYPEPLPEYVE